MKRLMTGECDPDNVFDLVDPTLFYETSFEAEAIKALTCLMPDYLCGIFAGAFVLEGERRISDLALIHKSLSHWFVVEVELIGHSFENHVLPQVRCFRYGDPDESCIASLVRGFSGMSSTQAQNVLKYVPRHVAVVSNIHSPDWTQRLTVLDVQHLSVFVYRDRNGRSAHAIEGSLIARSSSLGFATYSATDNCLRISKGCGIPVGSIQMFDQFGSLSDWTSREESGVLWISKNDGRCIIDHGAYVQIIRNSEGRLHLRPSYGGSGLW